MKTLEKFFKIIELLEEHGELRLQDIAYSLNIDKSTIHRFIKTLLHFDYVRKDKDTSKYSLGLRFLNIATKIINKLDLRKIAHPYLVELKNLTGETIHLTLFDGKSVVYIDKVESEKPVIMYSKVGNIAPIYCTAVGKVILAFQSDKLKNEILNNIVLTPLTHNTITDKKLLIIELEKVRKDGFATDRAEHENEICCIAAPIWDHNKNVNAAMSITAVRSRMDIDELMRYKNSLIEKSKLISKELGFISGI